MMNKNKFDNLMNELNELLEMLESDMAMPDTVGLGRTKTLENLHSDLKEIIEKYK